MSLPLIIAAAAGVYFLTSKKKSSSRKGPSEKTPCPELIHYDESDMVTRVVGSVDGLFGKMSIKIPVEVIRANDLGEKNLVTLAKLSLEPFIPLRCMDNFNVLVEARFWHWGWASDPEVVVAPYVVFTTAIDIGQALVLDGRYSKADVLNQSANLTDWFNTIAPEDFDVEDITPKGQEKPRFN